MRRVAYFKAQKMGCVRREKGARGLNCTAAVSSSKISLISGGLKQCYNAYGHLAKKYCKGIVPRALDPSEPDPALLEIDPGQSEQTDEPDTQILAPMKPIHKMPALAKRKVPRALTPTEPDPAILEIDPAQTEQSDQTETQIPAPMEPIEERPAPAIAKSTLCRFTSGPRTDETQDYAPMAPIPVGSNCQDARGSFGVVVAE